jgi:hypothetical protein
LARGRELRDEPLLGPELRDEPLRERELGLVRLDAEAFERDEPSDDRDEALRGAALALREDPLALVFEPERVDDPLRPLREADLAVEPVRVDDFRLFVGRAFERALATPPSLPPEAVSRVSSACSMTVVRPLCRRSYSSTRAAARPSCSRSAALTSSTSMSS